jgi:predicted kinase
MCDLTKISSEEIKFPMQKIKLNKLILIINGPSCGGKSTLINKLLEKITNVFYLKGDKIKWLMSDYKSQEHALFVEELLLNMMETTLKNNYSVIKEGLRGDPEKIKNLAKKYNYHLVFVNISAPKEKLYNSFEERMIAVKEKNAKVANTSIERFEELRLLYENTKIKTNLEFDRTKEDLNKIVETIIETIRKHK